MKMWDKFLENYIWTSRLRRNLIRLCSCMDNVSEPLSNIICNRNLGFIFSPFIPYFSIYISHWLFLLLINFPFLFLTLPFLAHFSFPFLQDICHFFLLFYAFSFVFCEQSRNPLTNFNSVRNKGSPGERNNSRIDQFLNLNDARDPYEELSIAPFAFPLLTSYLCKL